MLKVSFSDRSLPKSGSLVIPVFADSVLGTAAKELDEASGGYISAVMKRRDFTGTAGSVQVVTKPSGLDYDELVLVGLGQEVQTEKAKLLRKCLACSDPPRALRLAATLGVDVEKEARKEDLQLPVPE